MAIKKGKIESKSVKKVKNAKLQKIRDSKIDIHINDKDEYIEIIIDLDRILEPAPRARVSGVYKTNENGDKEMVRSRMYDPLSAYKDHLKKVFANKFLVDDIGVPVPFKGRVEVDLELTKVPSKSWSIKQKYFALKGLFPFLLKPDVDNVEKTLFDCLNKILFKDDCQIIKNKTKKQFGYADRTYAIFRLYKDNELPVRLSKEQMVEWKELEKLLIYNEDGGNENE